MQVPVSALPKYTALVRHARALILCRGDVNAAAKMAAKWPDTPGTRLTLEKAAVSAQSTADGFAEFGLAQIFWELYLAASGLGQLQPRMRLVPFKTKIPAELDNGAIADWIPESGMKPVRAFRFDQLELDSFKTGCLVVFSQELARMSTPAADGTIRRILVNATANFIDSEFLGAAAAVPGERPAGIANGQQTHVSTGSTLAAVTADLASMAAKLGSWGAPAWICHPKTFMSLAALDLVKFLPGGPQLCGAPIVRTTGSPAQLMLLDCDAVFLADDGQSTISAATQATVTMDDGESPTTTTLVSLWQNNLACLRVERFISWLAAHAAAVVTMDVTY